MKPFFTFFAFLFLLFTIYLLFYSCKPVTKVPYSGVVVSCCPDSLFTKLDSTYIRVPHSDTTYDVRKYLMPLPDNLSYSREYHLWLRIQNKTIAY